MAPEDIGRRLTQIRTAFALKPAEIADMLEIDRPAWTRFEKGQRVIPFDKAARLVERFSVTLDFIYLGRMGGLPLEVAERLRTAGGGN